MMRFSCPTARGVRLSSADLWLTCAKVLSTARARVSPSCRLMAGGTGACGGKLCFGPARAIWPLIGIGARSGAVSVVGV